MEAVALSSVFDAVAEMATTYGAIDLSRGVCDIAPPAVAVTAAKAAMDRGRAHEYAPSEGLLALRRQVAAFGGLSGRYDPVAEVTICAGCAEATAAALLAVARPGTAVLTFEPYYDYYPALAALAGARFVPVPLRIDAGGARLDVDVLASLAAERSVLLLNNPHNPTGHVFDRCELASIARLAIDRDLTIVTDEVYEQIVFDGPSVSIATLPGMRTRTVVTSSASKTFHLTGWRLGWCLADAPISRRIRHWHRTISVCAPSFLQEGLASAMEWAAVSDYYAETLVQLGRRRQILLTGLQDAGLEPLPQRGTFFILTRARRSSAADGYEDYASLIRTRRVAALPMTTFFQDDERAAGFLRFAFCRDERVLEEAVRRLRSHGEGAAERR